MRQIVIAGGSGFIGNALVSHFLQQGDHVIVLSRGRGPERKNLTWCRWDGRTVGDWSFYLEQADALINLCGRSVDCRYSAKNRKEILESRLFSTRVLGKAVAACKRPPGVWLQMASATIYRHAEDRPMDEVTGEIGSGFSVDVCQAWEREFNQLNLPETRKVLMRTSLVLGQKGGALTPLHHLVRFGLGGKQGSGRQMFSWIHIHDLVRAVEFLLQREQLAGPFNVTAPEPLPNREIMRALRTVNRRPFGISLPVWALEVGAFFIRTETELILKSRWVVPKRLTDAGFRFAFPDLKTALSDITGR
ncbi:MAG: TIGR01777 family protein [Flavobacteriales bacterium]|nr:TIGR01777 family oxidoreductase [Flavobacteriales bacterium]MCB9448095.1 TIGR01777 family protein [Flavobacteriales bacterium]